MKTIRFLPILLLAGLALPAAAQKLDYRQREELKRAQHHLQDAQGRLAAIEKSIEQVRASENPSAIPHGSIVGLAGQVDEARTKLGNVENALSNLPESHPEVDPVRAGAAEALEVLGRLGQAVDEIVGQFDEYRDIENYPDFAKDLQTLRGYAEAYSGNFNFFNEPERVADLARRYPESLAWYKPIFEKYRPLMQQKTAEGNEFYGAVSKFARGIKAFQAKCQEFVEQAPGKIDAALASARQLAARAQKEDKPAFFEGGVAQQLDQATRQLEVYSAILGAEHEEVKALGARLDEAKKEIDAAAAAMRESILASTRAPVDLYKGPDRAQLQAMIEKAWKEEWPADEVLGIHFHMQDWRREAGYEWDKGDSAWEAYDRSLLVVSVVVKTSDRLATIYPAYLNRNNLAGTTRPGVQTKGSSYVHREMLLSNYKP